MSWATLLPRPFPLSSSWRANNPYQSCCGAKIEPWEAREPSRRAPLSKQSHGRPAYLGTRTLGLRDWLHDRLWYYERWCKVPTIQGPPQDVRRPQERRKRNTLSPASSNVGTSLPLWHPQTVYLARNHKPCSRNCLCSLLRNGRNQSQRFCGHVNARTSISRPCPKEQNTKKCLAPQDSPISLTLVTSLAFY
jgi:hypothetical protein